MEILESQLSIVVCSKSDYSGLIRTLFSLTQLKDDLPEIILIVSDYSHGEISEIALRFSDLSLNIITTPAEGIYAAQNIGLKRVQNKNVMFLNGGDELANPKGIKKLVTLVGENAWGYGSLELINISTNKSSVYRFNYVKILHRLGLKYVPHPSTIIKVDLGNNLGAFDLKYKSAADHKLLLAFANISKPVVVKETISHFYLGGTSTRKQREIISDSKNISRDVCGYFFGIKALDSIIWHILLLLRLVLKS
jgi:glycosyltransferase involved in cell wall biosynthesis